MSRRRRQQIAVALLGTFIALVLAQRLGHVGLPATTDRARYHDKTFTVIKVVDGDTLDLDIPDPCRHETFTRVRLWGVDAPETKHPTSPPMYFGPEASRWATDRALGQQVTVTLEPFKATRGKYHRLLAYIYLPDGQMLNEQLIALGFGYADERFDHMLRTKFLQTEKHAQRQKLGLWKNVQPHHWPSWRRKRHDPTYVIPQPNQPPL